MRRFVLGQIATTLVTAAIFIAVFSAFGVWEKPLDARIAAMVLTCGALYAGIFLLRIIVKNREWDQPMDVAFVAAVLAFIGMMEPLGKFVALLAAGVWGIAVFIRLWRDELSQNRQWARQNRDILLWFQFLVIWNFLIWLGLR